MLSVTVNGPPAPTDAVRDVVEWGRVLVATLARGVVATLLGLALWAAAPAVLGWQPTTVMTGSMEPRLTPGDVVVARPVPASALRIGQVLLADDPDQPGHLRMHRAVAVGGSGTLVTKGDANPDRDSTPVARSAVHGVGFLRIPMVAAPIVWMRSGEWAKVALLALVFGATLWLCTVDGSLRRLVEAGASASASASDDDQADPGSGSGPGSDPRSVSGLEAALAPVPPPRSGRRTGRHVLSRRAVRHRARRGGRLRRRGTAAAVVIVTALGVVLPAQAVAAPFRTTTGNPTSTFRAGTAVAVTGLTCSNNGDNTVNVNFVYSGTDPVTSFDVMYGSTRIGTGPGVGSGTTKSVPVAGSSPLSLGLPITVTVRTNLGGTWTATSTSTTTINTALLSTALSC